MTSVLDELSLDDSMVKKSDIERRVEDWRARLDRLYSTVEEWLPEWATVDRSSTVRMNEELMRRYGVSPVDLSILNIYDGDQGRAKLVPRGLWIIGANGRIDLYVGESHYIVVDRSENFMPPDWRIASASERRSLRPLSKQSFIEALGS